MNVIIVNDYAFINGGAGKVAINMAELLACHGHNVVLFTAVGPISDCLKNIDNLQIICLYQDDILNNKNRLQAVINGLWNRKAAKEFEKVISGFETHNTIVHIHTLSKAISTSIIPVAKRHKLKIVYQLHDYGIACPNMGFFDFQTNIICRRKAMSLDCVLCNCDKRSYIQKCWRVLRQAVQLRIGGLPENVDCLIAVSEFSLNILKPYAEKTKMAVVLPNIIDMTKTERVHAEENKQFVFIGRLMPEKNPLILARACKKLGVEALFIGAGIEEKAIKRENPRATITGWVDSHEIKNYIRKARALVFPSKWYECHPLTVLESLACGVPVITSDACAAIDEIVDGENGRWFENEKVESLVGVMKEFADDKVVEAYSRNAYQKYWQEIVSEEQYYDRLVGLYNEVLN